MKLKIGPILELVVNLLLPWLAYRWALPHYGETGALYASAIPPIIWSIIEFIRTRRVDALSLVVLIGIVLSIVAMALGGDARMLLIRESFASGMIGVVFLLSLVLPRPLIFYLARATVAREAEGGAEEFEEIWNEHPALRRNLRLMTAVWGGGLTVEMLIRCAMAWYMSVERVLVVGPIVSYAIYGLLIAWTFWFRGRMRESAETA